MTASVSTTPRAIVFDLGKVLLDFDWQLAVRQLMPHVRNPLTAIQGVLSGSSLLHDYESGAISTSDFFEQVRSRVGFAGTFEDFAAGFGDIFTEIPEMVALHAAVRRAGYKTYLFSNTNELAIQVVRAKFPFFAEFDGWFLSYEQRVMKPAPRSYEIVETMAGLQGPDLFYLDDLPANVEGALARGWRAVVHVSPELSRQALAEAGVRW
ncbi:MAG: HAD family phosphatase [Verrucomicrobia bacterium]|nr:HAD family phosphatase [Verrucomicrobiota bacterium]